MNKRSFAIAALAVAGVIFSAGIVMADDLDDDDMMTGAGGGGWWKNMGAKNTFGCYLDPSDMSMSEFVLQARDMGVSVHAYQFDDIVFNYDAGLGTGSAEAWGRAWVDGMDVSFHLMLEDNGHRSLDRLMLEVSGDYAGTWEITGISGGQIWVYLE